MKPYRLDIPPDINFPECIEVCVSGHDTIRRMYVPERFSHEWEISSDYLRLADENERMRDYLRYLGLELEDLP